MKRARLICALALSLLASACALGPSPAPPGAEPEDGYGAAVKGLDLNSNSPVEEAWWKAFDDPRLDALIDEGLKANPGLAEAGASLKSANALVAAQKGAYLPSLGLSFTPSRQETAQTLASPLQNPKSPYDFNTSQLSLAFTPDLFGANRSAVQGLVGQRDAARFAYEAAKLNLETALAGAALSEGALTAEADDARQVVELEARLLVLLQQEARLGQASELDVAAAHAALAGAQSTLAPLEKARELNHDLILALTGRSSGKQSAHAQAAPFDLDQAKTPHPLPLVLPAELVRRRPDVRMAEAGMVSAGAGVGQAIAARLPSLELDGALGAAALSLSPKLGSDTRFWSVSAGLTAPLIAGGQLYHRQKAAEAAFEASKAGYRAAVVSALQSVSDALHSLYEDRRALMAADAAETAARNSLDVAEQQLRLGDISEQAYLNAKIAELGAHGALMAARAAELSDAAALYGALGGGWTDDGKGNHP